MVENVVEVDADFKFRCLAEPEELAQTEVHAPRTWTNQRVAFSNVGVIKDVGACGGQSEGPGIKEPISTNAGIRITDKARTETWTAEVANCINETAGDIAWENWIAVVAVPERRKACAALGKHVPRNLVAAKNSVFPLGSRVSEVPSLAERNVERTVRHEPVA